MEGSNRRTRMNVSITTKGRAQWDVTAEYSTPEESEKALSEAIDKVRTIIKVKGLVEASE